MPHFLTFKSESFTLTCVCESTTTIQSVLLLSFNRQSINLFVCSNETLGKLRSQIANSLQVSMNNLQIYNNDKLLNVLNDQKLLTKILPEERVRYWNGYMLFYRETNYNGLFQQDVIEMPIIDLNSTKKNNSYRKLI